MTGSHPPQRHPSLRTSLALTVLVMGVLGMALALATGEAYRRLSLDNQQRDFALLAERQVDSLLAELYNDTLEQGLSAQALPGFRQAFARRDEHAIVHHLDQHFHRAFVTLGIIQLAKLYAFDKDFRLVAASSEVSAALEYTPACIQLIQQASKRSGPQRLKPVSALCLVENKPYMGVIVPIGGLRLRGYLLLVVETINKLAEVGDKLATPLRLTLTNQIPVFQAQDWPEAASGEHTLLTTYTLKTGSGKPALHFNFATDITPLLQRLGATRNLIFAAASIAMLFTALIALAILQRTALRPLNTLAEHLRRVSDDRSHLGEPVSIQGNTEIMQLAEDFNGMGRELHTLYERLESMAFTDALTGLANRTLFYDRLQQAAYHTERNDTPFALFMMDLDRFKYVNDTLGHHIGDRILQEVAKRMQRVIRRSDTIARLGGDEFAILLPTIAAEGDAQVAAEKIIRALKKPIILEDHTLMIGVSIGIVLCPRDGTNTNLLMQRADVAMYKAKGRNLGYCHYNERMDSDNLFKLTIEAELREAVAHGDFELHYQPKIDFHAGRIADVEALIRWTHPEHGFIPPDKFIPLAEQTGLIAALTTWVLNTALSQCARWHAQGIDIGIAVNLSACSLSDGSIVTLVREALAKRAIEPHWLTLELTETAVMSDAARAEDILIQLDAMGVRLSVDDFGTGYSSLAYLKRLPVDEIKIDRSFVMEMTEDSNDAAIVRSTIDLAHNMGLKVVAEGIESENIWNQLAALHCDMGQGYHLCRPCPAVALDEWLKASRWGLRRDNEDE